MTKHPKIIVVIGPTGSGKSEFAVKLAKKMNGEIISADSRQVYKGLDIGTGKVQGQWKKMRSQKVKVKTATSNSKNSKLAKQNSVYVYKGIPHYCIDYVSPKKQYTVTNFKHDAELAIEDIVRRGNTPIICGGTGQYVDALLLDQSIPEVPPNPRLRAQLEKKTTAQLFSMLQKKDPARAKTIDPYNPRRLIRALEIITATGKPVPRPAKKGNPFAAKGLPFVPKIHYLNPPREELNKRIEKRLKDWLEQGLLKEIKKLHARGVPWKRFEEFGLEYKYAGQHLRGKIDFSTMCAASIKSIQQYSKRQQTWFKKYKTNL